MALKIHFAECHNLTLAATQRMAIINPRMAVDFEAIHYFCGKLGKQRAIHYFCGKLGKQSFGVVK